MDNKNIETENINSVTDGEPSSENQTTNEIPPITITTNNSQANLKPVKQIKNVSVSQCIKTIFVSLIALCVAFIPITFGNAGINMTFKALPIIGDATIINKAQANSATGFSILINSNVINIITMLLNIATIAFFAILLANILFSLFLAITRFQVFRIICKIYTILAGIAMIFIFAMSIIHVVGFAGLIIQGEIAVEEIMLALETSAILTAIGMAIMSGVLMFKQFKWFSRLY